MDAPRRFVIALMLAIAAVGCKSERKKHAGTTADPFVIGMSQCNRGEPWRVQMDADITKAAAAHGNVKLVMKDAQNDALVQRAQVEELVAQGIDLLIISPKEEEPLTKPVADAFNKGIPVIVLDRGLRGEAFTVFIGADNHKIGVRAGRWIAQALGGKGKIVELKGLMTSTPGKDRNAGFREGLDRGKNPGLEVVFEAEMKWLEPNARAEMESALTRHPQIDLVYAHNDPGAHGAYLAAKAAGRSGIKFVGIDALPHEGVRYVKDGILDATFVYPTGGAEAINAALEILKGSKVEKKIVLGTRLFTRDNVERGGEPIE
jgi:ribose transport system substrate-binding protein